MGIGSKRPVEVGVTCVVALLAAALLTGGGARADQSVSASAPVRCAQVAAEVFSANSNEVAAACHGTRDAAVFLAAIGVAAPAMLRVHVVEWLPEHVRSDAVGCFVVDARCVYVLTLQRFLASEKWFGVPTSPTLHRGVFTHEAAHAIVATHVGSGRLSAAALEYVAYVVMFATMDADVREGILAAAPAKTFADEASFNDITYSLDPMRFGVEAYRHWQRQVDGGAFLRRVLAGELIPAVGFGP